MIPYGRQDVSQADIDAVVEVLRSDFLTQGPMVPRFEETVANYCGAKHAVAVNSATSALHIACLALDLGSGDWLWTSPNTFVASANCALYCGAQVDFVDIDPRTYNLSANALEAKLQQAEREGRLPKIVIPVHFAGQPCDMPAIHALSEKYGFKIIEDASHAIGASYNDIKVGSCTHSDITVFSFHPVKIITTGEGGMATTNDAKLAERLMRLRTHGITDKPEFMQARPENEIWNYQQIELGFNYRMTDMQAALGVSQMSRLDKFVEWRRELAAEYDRAFANLPVITPWQQPGVRSSHHLYPIRIRKSDCGKTQRQVYDALWQNGVAANLHYIPVHRQPYYEAMAFRAGDFPEAERYHQEAISLPIYPGLTNADQDRVVDVISEELGSFAA
jgi:UDP-4-amino-4,6-dideoxy-N-acetyl-beta-L-altrosamine transaminase